MYHGGQRIVESHPYGRNKWQHEMLCAHQDKGVSRFSDSHGWRTFVVDGMTDARLDVHHFGQPRAEYCRDDGVFSKILAQL